MNPVDKVVSYFDPLAGYKRVQARKALKLIIENQKRGYEGAKKGSYRTSKWFANSSGANIENQSGMLQLRNRARDLERNSEIGRGVLDTMVSYVVGSGVTPQLKSLSGDAARRQLDQLGERFSVWAVESNQLDADRQCDYVALQELVFRSVVRDGEVFIRKRYRRKRDGLFVPLQFQILEADYVDHTKNENTVNGGYIIQGIEFDAIGRRRGYWIFDQHPNDVYLGKSNVTSKFIAASEIEHVYRVDRAGQVRGISWFAPIMIKLKDLTDANDAELLRRKIAACFAGFITDTTDAFDDEGNTDELEIAADLSPGSMEILPPGRDIRFSAPPRAEGYEEFLKSQLRLLSVGLGISYEALTSDFSETSYSSGRMSHLKFLKNVSGWQNKILIPKFCRPVTDAFLEAMIISENLGDEKTYFTHTPPRKEFIDPAKEVDAVKKEIRTGIKSWSEAVREYGREPAEVLTELKSDFDSFDKLDLILDCDPRRVSGAGNLAETEAKQESVEQE